MGFRHRYHIMMPCGDFFLPFQSTEKKGLLISSRERERRGGRRQFGNKNLLPPPPQHNNSGFFSFRKWRGQKRRDCKKLVHRGFLSRGAMKTFLGQKTSSTSSAFVYPPRKGENWPIRPSPPSSLGRPVAECLLSASSSLSCPVLWGGGGGGGRQAISPLHKLSGRVAPACTLFSTGGETNVPDFPLVYSEKMEKEMERKEVFT